MGKFKDFSVPRPLLFLVTFVQQKVIDGLEILVPVIYANRYYMEVLNVEPDSIDLDPIDFLNRRRTFQISMIAEGICTATQLFD